jgi:hypothetical protein
MSKLRIVLTVSLIVVGLHLALPASACAQYGGLDQEQALRPGVYVPFDGAGFSHRYNYEIGGMYYFNYDYRQTYKLDYLDRIDRWERAGHTWPSAKKGPAYQLQHIEDEYYRNLTRYRGPLLWDWRW